MNKIYEGYYEEKRSRFYALIMEVSTSSEVKKLKEMALKKEKSIKHCVSVSFYQNEGGSLVTSMSNSNEPIKVADKIMMSLQKHGISNIAVMVSRHYGGTPLGANNLSKAYYVAYDLALANYLKEHE